MMYTRRLFVKYMKFFLFVSSERGLSKEIKQKFSSEVNTIDSFQGQERDVIIMSCLRSGGIGFMSDPRLRVALTRAKHSLIICVNFKDFEVYTLYIYRYTPAICAHQKFYSAVKTIVIINFSTGRPHVV